MVLELLGNERLAEADLELKPSNEGASTGGLVSERFPSW